MKLFLQVFSTILIGIFLALGIAFLIWGRASTLQGLNTSLYRIKILSNKPEQNFIKFDPTKSSVLGITSADREYDNLDLKSTTNSEIKFEKIKAPFIVPSDGIAAHPNFLYNPVDHAGIDIWTNVNGKGLNSYSSKGSAVHAACSGTVTSIYYPNEEIEITCQPISDYYQSIVPSLKVKTLYAHLGDAISKEVYHSLHLGQKVTAGEIIGYQGNVSSIAPWNRVTHLHFGVYDLSKGGIPKPINPAPYIGVPTNQVGQIFKFHL